MQKYNIVIGGGHAGVEAATASARMGAKTILITNNPENLGEMSCNPAIGGVAKGSIVREVDALDGIMGKAIDMAGIHFKILNSSKGPAVHSPRAQADRKLYKKAINFLLSNYKNLTIIFAEALDIDIINDKVQGLVIYLNWQYYSQEENHHKLINYHNQSILTKLQDSQILQYQQINPEKYHQNYFYYIETNALTITTGTFLNGVIHVGNNKISSGRVGEDASKGLSSCLKKYNFAISRLKTGTPPRILKSSINFDNLEIQSGDEIPSPFSYLNDKITTKQINCYITYSNPDTHQIIKDNLSQSAMYGGYITGAGPRYCPSIEDKIHRFFDKNRHQIFLEPEGLDSDLIYPNGISTSLPSNIQEQFVRSISGLEKAIITQAGYAIEYDFISPLELMPTLETKKIKNLFLAGQINGTTGYEEAAGQGIIAGINMGIKASKNPDHQFIIDRSQAYIGVMIDDLTTLGTNEPYRMLTSRSEYRLYIRADNADSRLTGIGIEIGCVGKERAEVFIAKQQKIKKINDLMHNLKITPAKLSNYNINISQDGNYRSAFDLCAFPNIDLEQIITIWQDDFNKIMAEQNIDKKLIKQVAIDGLYHNYIKLQEHNLEILKKEQSMKIPLEINYYKINSISNEVREKLSKIRPVTIAAASKIQGITPASIMAILIHLKKNISKNS